MRLNNPVKETLRAGGSAIGVFVPIPSPDVVEIVAWLDSISRSLTPSMAASAPMTPTP